MVVSSAAGQQRILAKARCRVLLRRALRAPGWAFFLTYRALSRLLFRLDAERAHRLGTLALRLLQAAPPVSGAVESRLRVRDERLEQTLWDRVFPNPVGIAAGFDKDARFFPALAALGFGFVELGTVTPRPQPGNPRPRLFRHVDLGSLQNAMGFNSAGREVVRARLARAYPFRLPLGLNIGTNRDTPLERAEEDYAGLISAFNDLCDYFVVNVSSPNTPGLRELQNRGAIRSLMRTGAALTRRPLLLKLSPDLEPGQALEVSLAAIAEGGAGIVVANTTTDYSLVPGAGPPGGLSGRVLRDKSFRMLEALAAELHGRCVLISVGGIDSPGEVYRRLDAGASLVQVYTAFVYRGPSLAHELNRELLRMLERRGIPDLKTLVEARRTTAARGGVG